MSTSFEFEWDGAKAIFNLRKHGVDFDEAMGVFLDPLAMTRYDDEHSESETRWVTLGRSQPGCCWWLSTPSAKADPIVLWCD